MSTAYEALPDWVCLMYHDLRFEYDNQSGASGFFAVTPQTFAHHLELLRDSGLQACTIAHTLGRAIGNTIAISFDDGNAGQAEHAFPSLVKAGMTATFFVTTSWVGRHGFASWDQLREMRAAGMAIESHTHTHPFLSELSESELRDELRRSRDIISERLEAAPTMIALPGGDSPRGRLRGVFLEEGYQVVATSRWGVNSRRAAQLGSSVRVHRCTVRGESTDENFLAIAHADRWLSARKWAREGTLALARRLLGPSRYAARRRALLDVLGSVTR